MDQYTTLWDDNPGYPPFLVNVFNNLYAMGASPPARRWATESQPGWGGNQPELDAHRAGRRLQPLAVADATARKKALLLEGKGPAMLDTITYRYSGHSPSDAMTYRTKEELMRSGIRIRSKRTESIW